MEACRKKFLENCLRKEKSVTSPPPHRCLFFLYKYFTGAPSQKRAHLLNYTGHIANSSTVANMLVRYGVLSGLAKQIKDAQHIDL